MNLFYGLAGIKQHKVGPGEDAVLVGANNTSDCSICLKCVPELFPFGFLNALNVKETAVGHKNHTRTPFGASTPEKKIKEYEKISSDIFRSGITYLAECNSRIESIHKVFSINAKFGV